MEFDNSVSTNSAGNLALDVPKRSLNKDLYVIQAGIVGPDERWNKLGSLYTVSLFYTAAVTASVLFVEYDAELWGAAP
jgi:hypothetical protein